MWKNICVYDKHNVTNTPSKKRKGKKNCWPPQTTFCLKNAPHLEDCLNHNHANILHETAQRGRELGVGEREWDQGGDVSRTHETSSVWKFLSIPVAGNDISK